eukprot:TRINITY_DN2888_c0_g1_i1.p1 TRINITY_DN2888_c0_g1~~TRINITY_DN2888_c0_g1_i1.p1  ORF type:complete len:211 (-),score=30.87 TRINITY_DN2888_c0_g1_i1:7-639(-)
MDASRFHLNKEFDVIPKTLLKFDRQGKYSPFPGMTIVSDLITDLGDWFNEMQTIFPKHKHTLLPLASYHMTIQDLWTFSRDYQSLQEYNQSMDEMAPKLVELERRLHESESTFQMKVVKVDFTRLTLEPLGVEDRQVLDNWKQIIHEVMGPPRTSHRPHLTLSYHYNIEAKIDIEKANKSMQILSAVPQTLKFATPHVCTFQNMESFVPI